MSSDSASQLEIAFQGVSTPMSLETSTTYLSLLEKNFVAIKSGYDLAIKNLDALSIRVKILIIELASARGFLVELLRIPLHTCGTSRKDLPNSSSSSSRYFLALSFIDAASMIV